MAKPTLWMTCAVPLTQMLPLGLRTRCAAAQPGAVEFVICVGALRAVPGAFVDADHFAGVAGDAAVGEEVGRVGEDEVDAVGGHGGEDLEAVALKEFDVVARVVEKGIEWGRGDGARRLRGCGSREICGLERLT